ncbi:potassium transport protein 1 [Lentithecium fluviatile CBS 122367]|uniref:Potassium transport protein 1 n=1 Tax=Lentithecium fluviatile CBS 122367 TaxID=1168545 RepID=A0A6G1JFA9_9PLEO|nr:potassium transport protein 1 [Lentithecium fluviatile CBS 122367]
MWKPAVNFITLHYTYILSFGILALTILYPYGNLAAIDAYFFGVSASTESGLNTVDVKALKTYQQLFIYVVPIVTNLGFVNVAVVVVRLHWFRKRFKGVAKKLPRVYEGAERGKSRITEGSARPEDPERGQVGESAQPSIECLGLGAPHISFAPEPKRDDDEKKTLGFAESRERENNVMTSLEDDEDEDAIKPVPIAGSSSGMRRRNRDTRPLSRATSMDRALSSIFVLGSTESRFSHDISRELEPVDLASLTREELGGIEYRALTVLLKVTTGYFFGLHLFGVICMVPWIHLANAKYKDYLASQGIDKTWWAFYSAQTMVDNLGFTLTPDSMVSFRDATWPMLLMSFLAFAGNTFYPCFLRLLIWAIYKLTPATSSLKESLRFLLDHPRRCYTLLFSSTATWTLASVLVTLNSLDVLLIIVLDLDNPEVNVLPVGSRILAAIFQAASSRHTGTSTFNLANVNPAVQFSLLVMMYISIYPIAISIRMSNTYEEQAVGVYGGDEHLDEGGRSQTYLLTHMRNQLSFDLWYIFLGVFCICCSESKRIMDNTDPAFSVFSVFFEVVSAYGNVGLSLGHPSNLTSLCGHFTVFSKLVICAMMIRGRHRGMPYALDRTITLPSDRLADQPPEGKYRDEHETGSEMRNLGRSEGPGRIRKAHTQ